jgi:hypothetical protein
MFEPSPAASISVLTKDQAETDRLWTVLLADGGKESMCGWLAVTGGLQAHKRRRTQTVELLRKGLVLRRGRLRYL